MESCNLNMGPRIVIMGPLNMDRGPWNVNRGRGM
jgi:hypothetical protein